MALTAAVELLLLKEDIVESAGWFRSDGDAAE